MAIYRFPPNPEENPKDPYNSKTQKQSNKISETIYADEVSSSNEKTRHRESLSEEEIFGDLKSSFTKNGEYPIFFRFLTLFFGSILTLWIAILIIMLLIYAGISIITFFNSPYTIQKMRKLWKKIGNYSALTLALFVATLSPNFGLAIFAAYTCLNIDSMEQMPFIKIFKPRNDSSKQ